MALYRRGFIQAAAAVGAALAGCSGSDGRDGGATVEETSEITMAGSQFDPRNTHVETGTPVTWRNDESADHTVTSASDNWTFDARVEGGGTAEYTFEESGVYDVYCRFHGEADLSGMSMKVGVGEATITAPIGGGDQGGGAY